MILNRGNNQSPHHLTTTMFPITPLDVIPTGYRMSRSLLSVVHHRGGFISRCREPWVPMSSALRPDPIFTTILGEIEMQTIGMRVYRLWIHLSQTSIMPSIAGTLQVEGSPPPEVAVVGGRSPSVFTTYSRLSLEAMRHMDPHLTMTPCATPITAC